MLVLTHYLPTAAPKYGPCSGVVLPGFQKNRCP